MSPPRLDILDENMHHRVLSPLFDVVALKQKSVSPKAQFGESLSESKGL
jgi:hypothetical protein